MSPEERELLVENNQILRGLRRAQRWGTVGSLLKWILIIGSALGAYYYLQPYLDKILEFYERLPDLNTFLPPR